MTALPSPAKLAEIEAAARRYYHGGPGGIALLDWIQPPTVTGCKSSAEYGPEEFRSRVRAVHRTDRVYVTTNATAAAMFAAAFPDGTVYEVEPHGELEPDPDCSLAGLSYACERAQVLRKMRISEADRLTVFRALLGMETTDD